MLLTIEKLIYGGDGLARLPADEASSKDRGRGKAVFVPFVLEGEKVDARITEQKAGFARAAANTILEPSSHRITPMCPYFTRCGGCHYQHASYEHQLNTKKEIFRETLRRTTKLDLSCEIQIHPSPPWNYRNRSRLQVRTRPAFIVGYFKQMSHDVLAVEQCPISSPLINRGIAAVWQFGRAGKVPDGILEIEFFANADDSQLLVEIGCSSDARRSAVRTFAEELRTSMAEIVGVVALRESNEGSLGKSDKFLLSGAEHLTYATQGASYRVSAGAFFQTNRYLSEELPRIVTKGESGQTALDLYSGVGLFASALASDFDHIFAVESSQLSTGDLSYNLPSNGEAVRATTEQYLARWENSGRVGKGAVLPHTSYKPDLAVIDPPRIGLGERVARLLTSLGAPRVTYISCDPATLARDLVVLLAAGYRVQQAHVIDLFPQTYHIESVLKLQR